MIGTTHFINALVEAQRLAPTAALRLGLPATAGAAAARRLARRSCVEALSGRGYLAHGGYEFDGRPISAARPRRAPAARRATWRAHGIRSVAISSVFPPSTTTSRSRRPRIVAEELGPDVAISLSHEIGRIGLLERENATIINAALRELAVGDRRRPDRRRRGAGHRRRRIFLSQNDGTLMDVDYVRRYPVATFASGPTNSMRGAALHERARDVRGRRHRRHHLATSACSSTASRARPTIEVKVAGVRTNFRMPDVLSIGIGGGSHRRRGRPPRSGRDSVGYQLTDRGARVRRRHADGDRHRRGRRPRRRSATPSLVAHLDRGRSCERVLERIARARRRGRRPDAHLARADPRRRGRRRLDPAAGRAPASSARCTGPTTTPSPTPSAPPSRRSAARSTRSSRSSPAAATRVARRGARRRRSTRRSPPAPTPRSVDDRRLRRGPDPVPARQRDAHPRQGRRRPRHGRRCR